MNDEVLREILQELVKESQGNYARYVMSLIDSNDYNAEKESIIEYAIGEINNLKGE